MPAGTFADALKAARMAAGLSQAELARRAGLTGSYVCVLESRRKPPPSGKVVSALCKALGIADQEMLDLAALERAPDPVRRKLERLDRERGRAVRTRDRFLTTTLFHIAQSAADQDPLEDLGGLSVGQRSLLGKLFHRVRSVRNAREAEERASDLLGGTSSRDREALADALPRALVPAAPPAGVPSAAEDPPTARRRLPVRTRLADAPAPAEETWLDVDPSMWRDGAFLWKVGGDDAWPRVERGDLVLVDPSAEPRSGDLVALSEQGVDQVRTYQVQDGEVRLDSVRADAPPLRRSAAGLRLAGVVRWVVRPLRP
jgi:transcriptional regulator with XRE-family HTH domain/SOS-response transcriptional repressor LexA